MRPGEQTLHWIHFGVVGSAVVAGVAGIIPLPFGAGIAVAALAGAAKNTLIRKQKDQEDSMIHGREPK